jgi:hypothetical protein
MFLNPNSDELIDIPGFGQVKVSSLVSQWERDGDIPAEEDQFESEFPTEADLFSDNAGPRIRALSRRAFASQQVQLENIGQALGQTMYVKVVDFVGENQWDLEGGTLNEFLPAIGELASGLLNDLNFDGSTAGEGLQGVATEVAMEMVQQVMTKVISSIAAIPVAGPIIAAVLYVGFAFFKAAKRQQQARDERERLKENSFYQDLRDMQGFYKHGDEVAMGFVLETMRSTDWTNLFLPAFDPRADWVGAMRSTGFEFFPGDRGTSDEMEFMLDGNSAGWGAGVPRLNEYKGKSNCLGMIPGTQQITDTIQSRVSAYNMGKAASWVERVNAQKGNTQKKFREKKVDTLWEFLMTLPPSTMGADSTDAGDYLPSATQTMSFLWGHMQMQGASGNPDLYRVNCPYIDGQWRAYYRGAYDFIEEMCSWDMFDFDMDGDSMVDIIAAPSHFSSRIRRMEAQYACAIPCQMGVYRCYSQALGGGFMAPTSSMIHPSCNVGFNNFPSECEQDLWSAYIHDAIVELHTMQYRMLRSSLVCAYASESLAAFVPSPGDNGQAEDLLELMRSQRDALLTRPDQWEYLVEENVPRAEDHRGSNWYGQLEAVGAFDAATGPGRGKMSIGAQPGNYGLESSGDGFDEQMPLVMQLVGRLPGEEDAPGIRPVGGSSSSSGGGGMIIAGAAALALYAMLKK